MPQDENQATTTRKITPKDRWLDSADTAIINERKIRAYHPAPGAFVLLGSQPLKIISAHLEGSELIFDEVQPAGKKPMTWKAFQSGWRKPLHFEPYQDKM